MNQISNDPSKFALFFIWLIKAVVEPFLWALQLQNLFGAFYSLHLFVGIFSFCSGTVFLIFVYLFAVSLS